MRNPETNRAESLRSPGVRAEPYPVCKTQAEHFPDSLHRGCTANAFRPPSEQFAGVCLDFLLSVRPNICESEPKHHRDLPRMRSHSAKQWLSLDLGGPSPTENRSARRSQTRRSRSGRV